MRGFGHGDGICSAWEAVCYGREGPCESPVGRKGEAIAQVALMREVRLVVAGDLSGHGCIGAYCFERHNRRTERRSANGHLPLHSAHPPSWPASDRALTLQAAKGALHTLDYSRIKDAHRATARALLLSPETNLPNALALQLSTSTAQITGTTSNAAAARAAQLKAGKGRLMTPEEKRRVVEALTRAKTTDEVRRLERMLAEGVVPEEQVQEEEVVQVEGQEQVEGQVGESAHGEGKGDGEDVEMGGEDATEPNGKGNGNDAVESEANGA